MQKRILSIIIFLFIFSSAFSDEIFWYNDINTALGDAKKQQKNIMIDFYTDWCSWCFELDKKTYSDKDVIKLSKQFIALKVNPEKSKDANSYSAQFSITGFPTIIFVDYNGSIVTRIGGFIEAEPFANKMRYVLKANEIPILLKKYNEGDLSASYTLLDILYNLSRMDEAIPIILSLDKQNKIPASKKLQYYNEIALQYLNTNQASLALKYLNYNEKNYSFDAGNDYYYCLYYKGYALAQANKIDESKKFVNGVISSNKLSNEWKEYFTKLLEWLNNQ